MNNQHTGKVALVTGGNSGMGRTTAIAFAERGANVVIAARRVAEGEETVAIIKQAGGEATFVQTDVSIPADVEVMVERVVATYWSFRFCFQQCRCIRKWRPDNRLPCGNLEQCNQY